MNEQAEFQGVLDSIQSSKTVIDECAVQRQQKFQDSLRNYLNYIRKESTLLQANVRHCDVRNQQCLEEVRKSHARGTANSRNLIQMMTRTNRDKLALQKYIDQAHEMDPLEDRSRFTNESREERAADLSRYRQILEEYKSRLA